MESIRVKHESTGCVVPAVEIGAGQLKDSRMVYAKTANAYPLAAWAPDHKIAALLCHSSGRRYLVFANGTRTVDLETWCTENGYNLDHFPRVPAEGWKAYAYQATWHPRTILIGADGSIKRQSALAIGGYWVEIDWRPSAPTLSAVPANLSSWEFASDGAMWAAIDKTGDGLTETRRVDATGNLQDGSPEYSARGTQWETVYDSSIGETTSPLPRCLSGHAHLMTTDGWSRYHHGTAAEVAKAAYATHLQAVYISDKPPTLDDVFAIANAVGSTAYASTILNGRDGADGFPTRNGMYYDTDGNLAAIVACRGTVKLADLDSVWIGDSDIAEDTISVGTSVGPVGATKRSITLGRSIYIYEESYPVQAGWKISAFVPPATSTNASLELTVRLRASSNTIASVYLDLPEGRRTATLTGSGTDVIATWSLSLDDIFGVGAWQGSADPLLWSGDVMIISGDDYGSTSQLFSAVRFNAPDYSKPVDSGKWQGWLTTPTNVTPADFA